MTERVTLGSWLKQQRKKTGKTQDELADLIGCSLETLQKIQSGVRRPSRQIAERLAELFSIPADEREAFVTFARVGLDANEASGDALISENAPWRTIYARHANLPTALTDLIGREREEDALRELLTQSNVRLLTLTGPPGVGKTRLGVQTALGLVERFEDGVFFVDLSPISDPDLVVPAVARSLGVTEAKNQPIEDALQAHLRDKRMLLVLDNFEQVLDATPKLVRLMESSRWIKALVTSREALHVRGERRFAVPPLGLPDSRQLTLVESLIDCPSVELFVERAQAANPDFALTQANAGDVAAVCVGLEGLPLAIELAAARARLLTTRQMRDALVNRLQLLTGRERDATSRHHTLRGTIEWSYELLNEDERRLFRWLSVFVGGFTLEAAEAVCGGGDDGRWTMDDSNSSSIVHRPSSIVSLGIEVREGLAALADKSLIKAEGQPEQARFGMLETIREYALEKLLENSQPRGVPEAEAAEKQHALYFMELAEEAEPHLAGPEQIKWLDQLEREYDNVRAALRWAREHSERGQGLVAAEALEIGLRLAGALGRFWKMRGYLSEGRNELAAALERSNVPTFQRSNALRAKALNSGGVLSFMQGDYASARALHEASLAIWQAIGDKWGVAAVLTDLGRAVDLQGDYAAARALHEESLTIRRELGDRWGIAASLNNLGLTTFTQGDYAAARALHEESLTIRRELGDKRGIAVSLNNLGLVTFMQGDYAAARALHEESLTAHRETGDKWSIGVSLGNLGNTANMQGDYKSARAYYNESLTIRRELGDKIGMAVSMIGLGAAASGSGEAERGAKLLGAGAALREALSAALEIDDQMIYDHGVTSTRSRLDEAAFTEAWVEGHALTWEQAVAYALEEM